jgi:hypothetical protein
MGFLEATLGVHPLLEAGPILRMAQQTRVKIIHPDIIHMHTLVVQLDTAEMEQTEMRMNQGPHHIHGYIMDSIGRKQMKSGYDVHTGSGIQLFTVKKIDYVRSTKLVRAGLYFPG